MNKQANSIDTTSLQTKFSLSKSASNKEAITLLSEIITQLDGKKLTLQQQDLLNRSQARYNTLTSSVSLENSSAKITLPEKNIKIGILDNIIYAFGNNTIYKAQTNHTKLTQSQRLASTQGNILALSGPSSSKTFYILTSKQKIIEYSPSKNIITELKSIEPWKDSISISSFNTNLYLLDQQNNQIWKYLPGKNNLYNQATPYLKTSNTEIAKLKNIAIDGTLYSITSDGILYKINKTNLTKIPITKLPVESMKPANPIFLTTTSDLSYFFITEPHRVIMTDKQGKYVKQFVSKSNINSIFIQPILKKIWIATDQNLISISY